MEYYDELMDCSCPNCNYFDAPMLAIVSYPTLEELRANSDRPGVRELVQKIDRGLDEFEAQKLRTPEQLPEIGEDNFNLIWDFEADEDYGRTLIKHGDVVIFSEPARWEESRRFKEVAEILKAMYGDRIKDLVPTEGSKLNLYGDDGKSPGFVDNVRAWFFGATTTPREGALEWQEAGYARYATSYAGGEARSEACSILRTQAGRLREGFRRHNLQGGRRRLTQGQAGTNHENLFRWVL